MVLLVADQFKKRGRRVIANSHPLPSYTLVPTIFAHEVFEEAVALSMSVEAFKRNRKVRWDPAKEVIVS